MGLPREILIVGTLVLMPACAYESMDHEPDVPPVAAEPGRSDTPTAPIEPAAPPDADSLLPPLADYATDDDAESGELKASLDHGSVPYLEVRRRLILDDQGFASGEVTVVTLQREPAAAERLLAHRYGDAPRSRVRLGGKEVIRIETEPHATFAWVEPGFVVTFQRGQERSEEWLEELVRATLRAVDPGSGEPNAGDRHAPESVRATSTSADRVYS